MKPIHCAIVIFLFLAGCGPGVSDVTYPILDKYVFSDAGGDQKTVIYEPEDGNGGIVVDARVDKYLVYEKLILVARRPWIDEMHGNTASGKLSQNCEYWIIDTATHSVTRTENNGKWPELKCDPQ